MLLHAAFQAPSPTNPRSARLRSLSVRSVLCPPRRLKPTSCAAPPSARLPLLQAHLSTSGVRLPSLALRPTHAVAARDIAAGEPLVVVPRSAAILARGAVGGHPSWDVVLAARLLAERHGVFAEYVASLPREPLGVGCACLKEGVEGVAERMERYWIGGLVREYWEKMRADFEEGRRKGVIGEVAWEDFVWARGVVASRAFRVDATGEMNAGGKRGDEGEFALLPGLDMLNHSVICKTDFRFCGEAGEREGAGVQGSGGEYCISSGLGFEEGEEVFVSYGAKTNLELLFHYGFVEGNNPADSVRVSSSDLLRRVGEWCGVAQPGEKTTLLRSAGLLADNDSIVYHLRRDGIDDALVACLRVLLASDTDLSAVSLDNLRSSEWQRRPLSLKNELRTWRFIAHHCDLLLEKLPAVSPIAAQRADDLRCKTICSAEWEWSAVGAGETVAEALYVAERREVLEATRARVLHFADVSERIGRVTTVLLPPSQSLLSTKIFDGLSPVDGNSGVRSYTI